MSAGNSIGKMENVTEISDRSAEYHVIAKRWKSDLEFFKIESAFLHSLQQDYYFTKKEDYNNTEFLQKAGDHLLNLQQDIIYADTQVNAQLHQLTLVAENILNENSRELALTNATVGHLMIKLTHKYQAIKKDFFTSVEGVFRELNVMSER